ncbi:MAG: small ribosomal subunit Rsm22 family protein [Pseudomonadota bacterium]
MRRTLGVAQRSDPLDREERARLVPMLRRHVDGFTVERSAGVRTELEDERMLAAYLAYYGARSFAVSQLMARAYGVDGEDVLELGCGPGSAGLALLSSNPGARWQVVEPSRRAVAMAGSLAGALGLVTPELVATDIRDLHRRPLHARTVIAFNTVNEWPLTSDEKIALLSHLVAALPPEGILLVVEPALRQTARALSALRDGLLAAGHVVRGPCTHALPCPMLRRRRDFCHGRLHLDLPEDLLALGDEAGHLRLAAADLATLVVARAGPPRHSSYRVVGDVLCEKGRDRLFVCGKGELTELSVQTGRRHAGADWLRGLKRGDVLDLDAVPGETVHRVLAADALHHSGWLP